MSDLDRRRIEEFLDKFVSIAAGATTIGLLALADRSGLSEYLSAHPDGTAVQIAAGAGLEERYVREIMSGLAAAGVVDYDADTMQFHLPPEHALFIADETSPYFMGGYFDMIPGGMGHIDEIADAVRHGGGVLFDQFGARMIRGIERGNAPSQRVFLTGRWLAAVPGLVERLESGIRVADVGCGTGTAAIEMARAFPESSVIGFDASEESIEMARSNADALANLSFEHAGAAAFPIGDGFGLITTFDVVHDLVDPLAALTRIREALDDQGVYLMMEPNLSSKLEDNLDPRGALFYGVSTLHCMTQSLAQGGPGLGAAWGRQNAAELAKEAGFTSFEPLERITNRFSAFYLLKA
ncbi:MAG: class I SAM-dependent methyltransferase [Acidimicrobiia bacterium]